MSKLFLTSYLAGTKNLVKEFLKDVPEKEITFVPTASNTEDYKGYVDEAKQAFLELGFSINILDISKTAKQKIENILKDTKILYVSGGNTFYLLQELKRKKILDTIKNKISNFVIEKVAQSFMAKIPAGTRVSLIDGILKVGDSVISLGENIREAGVKTRALVENTHSRAMQIVSHRPPVVQPKHRELTTA